MISLSLSVPPPYLTYILIGYKTEGMQCPELNRELINSPHIYAGLFIFMRGALRAALLQTSSFSQQLTSSSKRTEQRFSLFLKYLFIINQFHPDLISSHKGKQWLFQAGGGWPR